MTRKIQTIAISLHIAGLNFAEGLKHKHAAIQSKERGSITLEQILWTVGIIAVAGTAVGIFVAAANSKISGFHL